MVIEREGRLIDGSHIVEWRKESVQGSDDTTIVIGKTAWGTEVEVERGTEAECDACLARARAHIEERYAAESEDKARMQSNVKELTAIAKKTDAALHKMDRLLASIRR